MFSLPHTEGTTRHTSSLASLSLWWHFTFFESGASAAKLREARQCAMMNTDQTEVLVLAQQLPLNITQVGCRASARRVMAVT